LDFDSTRDVANPAGHDRSAPGAVLLIKAEAG
jgi:hypothetical protein